PSLNRWYAESVVCGPRSAARGVSVRSTFVCHVGNGLGALRQDRDLRVRLLPQERIHGVLDGGERLQQRAANLRRREPVAVQEAAGLTLDERLHLHLPLVGQGGAGRREPVQRVLNAAGRLQDVRVVTSIGQAVAA